MKETITPDMIAKCQEIIKKGDYDFDKFTMEVGPMAPCSVVQGLFPDILDMALEHLKRKASHSLVEWMQEEPKTNNKGWSTEKGGAYLKNTPLPVYDWDLVQ